MVEKLSKEQKEECKEVFDLLDKDKEGLMKEENLGPALRSLGTNPTTSELEEMIDEIKSKNKKYHKKIEFSEFIEQYCKILKDPDTESDLLESFRIFDTDGTGILTRSEFKEIMMKLGVKFSENEAEEMLRVADVENKGYVLYEEFVHKLMQK